MPKLLVHRGESLDREIELTGRTLRIGRSADNDVMLEDAGKSVSRTHAEVRYENGRYVLVDRESQNGLWVSGARLTSVVLEPNVVASIGPYRLSLDSPDSSPLDEAVTTALDEAVTTESGAIWDTVPARETIPSKASTPVRPPQIPAPRRESPAKWFGVQPKWLLSAIGAVTVGAFALAIWMFVDRPVQAPPSAPNPLDRLETRIINGDCEGALTDLEAILVSTPADPRALELKQRADACRQAALPPPPPPPPVDDIGQQLGAVAVMLQHGQCQEARTEIDRLLLLGPTNAEVVEMKKRVDSCGQPPATKVAASPINTLPPEQGGLPSIEGENEKNYQARVAAMNERYTDAESAFAAQDYARAITLFDSILRDTGPKYQRVTERLAESKARLKDGAQKALQAAREFESKGELRASD